MQDREVDARLMSAQGLAYVLGGASIEVTDGRKSSPGDISSRGRRRDCASHVAMLVKYQ